MEQHSNGDGSTGLFDNRAVSPVIGVILMVAVTVILAGVITTFVLGMGQDMSSQAPQVSLDVDADSSDGNITITHDGGAPLEDGRTKIIVRNESSGDKLVFEPGDSGESFGVGDRVVVDVNNTGDGDGVGIIGSSSDVWDDRPVASIGFIGVQQGTDYTVIIVDTETDGKLLDRTVTA